jgi:hypothetical protein
MGQPPSVVLGWPASDVHLLGAYLAREPAPTERLEYGLAYLSCQYHNAHSESRADLERFMLFRRVWRRTDGRYSENDLEILDSIDRIT